MAEQPRGLLIGADATLDWIPLPSRKRNRDLLRRDRAGLERRRAGALGRLGDVAGRHRPARIDAQAAAIEILGRLAVQLHRLLARLGDPDELQEPRAIRVQVLAEPLHLLPEALHRGAAVLEAEIG